MQTIPDWTLTGSDDQPIIGTTHRPEGAPRGTLIACHGFKGYKDYGFFPRLCRRAAEAGLIAHRFNFSHSGMTNRTETFEKPELFEKDTYSKQVADLQTVHAAVRTIAEELPVAYADLARKSHLVAGLQADLADFV